MNSELTPKQQTSEAVRQADTILILTGQHPSVDQVTAVLALAMILRKLDKKVSAIISDKLPSNVGFLPTGELDSGLSGQRDFIVKLGLDKAEVDSLQWNRVDGQLHINITPFKGGFEPSDVSFDYGAYHYDMVMVLGVPTRSRIDRVYAENPELFKNLPLLNLDFHRSNENYGAVNLIDPNAASLNEMLVALSESLQTGLIDEPIATVMLAGIMASTDRFTATHTTAKALTVAAQMMAAGAKQQVVVNGLYKGGKGGTEQVKRDEPTKRDEPVKRDEPAKSEDKPAIEASSNDPAPVAAEPVEAHAEPVDGSDEPVEVSDQAPEFEEVPIEDLLPPEHIVAETEGIDTSDPSTIVHVPNGAQAPYDFEDLPKEPAEVSVEEPLAERPETSGETLPRNPLESQ